MFSSCEWKKEGRTVKEGGKDCEGRHVKEGMNVCEEIKEGGRRKKEHAQLL